MGRMAALSHCGHAAAGGDCDRDLQGSWPLNSSSAASWPAAAHACKELCSACSQCNYISYSTAFGRLLVVCNVSDAMHNAQASIPAGKSHNSAVNKPLEKSEYGRRKTALGNAPCIGRKALASTPVCCNATRGCPYAGRELCSASRLRRSTAHVRPSAFGYAYDAEDLRSGRPCLRQPGCSRRSATQPSLSWVTHSCVSSSRCSRAC